MHKNKYDQIIKGNEGANHMQKLSSVLLLNITAPPVPTFDDLLL